MISLVISKFNELKAATEDLSTSLLSSKLPIWIPLSEEELSIGLTEMEKVIRVISAYWYQDGQEGRETINAFGLVCITREQFEQIHTINRLKLEFKEAANALEKNNKEGWLEARSQLKGCLFRESHLSRLHKKQTWRTIQAYDDEPYKITFNWYSSGRSIKKISIPDAEKLLVDMGAEKEHISVQLSQLGLLPSGTPLAQVQPQAPLMRANLVYRAGNDNKVTGRKALNAALPIFIVGEALPLHNEPELRPPEGRSRAQRSDQKIDPNPYLPSIRAHLYKIAS